MFFPHRDQSLKISTAIKGEPLFSVCALMHVEVSHTKLEEYNAVNLENG